MAEYIIDMGDSSYKSSSGLLCADVSQLREEIVRCKDCQWKSKYDSCMRLDEWHESDWFDVEPNGFCAWGERND